MSPPAGKQLPMSRAEGLLTAWMTSGPASKEIRPRRDPPVGHYAQIAHSCCLIPMAGNSRPPNPHQEKLVANALEPAALDQLFRTGRSINEWSEIPVDEHAVRELYDLLKWGPTS